MILIKRNIIDINQNSEKRCEDCDIRYDGDEVIWWVDDWWMLCCYGDMKVNFGRKEE